MTRMTVLLVLLFAVFSAACGANPEAIAEEFQTAINTQDVESALGLMAEDVVLQVEDQAITGKADARKWLESQARLDLTFEGTPASTDTGVNFENCTLRSDVWSYFKLNEMTGSCALEIADGLITGFLIEFDADSTNQLGVSPALDVEDLVSIWTTQWPAPGTTREDEGFFAYYYLQFNPDGTGRLARAPEDLSVPPDSEHTGADLIWAYDSYVLTIQNDGAASEGYCLEEEVGAYLVRKDGDGGIQFRPIEDACVWRKLALERTRASWDPYLP